MPNDLTSAVSDSVRFVIQAADFAARRHSGQTLKGPGAAPYINHLTEVAALVAASS